MADYCGNPRLLREELSAKSGLNVQCILKRDPDQVVVGFEMIPNAKNPSMAWTKAFVLDTDIATPFAFLTMLAAWKVEMQKKIDARDTAGVLGAVLAEYDEPRVREALAHRETMH